MRVAVLVTGGLGLGALAVACVLLDPPPTVNPVPPARPLILHSMVSPSLDTPLSAVQGVQITVPVLIDPDEALYYRVFIDLAAKPGTQDVAHNVDNPPAVGGNGVYTLDLTKQINVPPNGCHTITLVVGTGFVPNFPSTPVDPPGGDSATWSYSPTPDCSTFYDAGNLDATLDADDASDGTLE